MKNKAASVCMASYNGSKFIKEQIATILPQLSEYDELVIVDDNSNDNTVDIIKSFQTDKVILFENEKNRGHVKAFQKAISLSHNEYIILSDQDDLWLPGRLNLIKDTLNNSEALVLTSNFDLMYYEEAEVKINKEDLIRSENSKRYLKNIFDIMFGRIPYYGSAMAFKRELLKIIFPIPSFVESHDIWIAIAANLFHTNVHINEKTLIRRIHGNNVSKPNRSLIERLKSRVFFTRSIVRLLFRRYIL